MNPPVPLTCAPSMLPECHGRLERVESDVRDIRLRQQEHGEKLASLGAYMVVTGAAGSVIGGGIVAAIVRLMGH